MWHVVCHCGQVYVEPESLRTLLAEILQRVKQGVSLQPASALYEYELCDKFWHNEL